MHQHEKLYHIGLCKADLEGADYAILPGDPGRVEKIAALMENAKEIGRNREYTSWLAETKGVKVLVMSTGMGGPSTAIGVEELHMLGAVSYTHQMCIRDRYCSSLTAGPALPTVST